MDDQKKKQNRPDGNKKRTPLIVAAAALVILAVLIALILSKCGSVSPSDDGDDRPPRASEKKTETDSEVGKTSSGDPGDGAPGHVHSFGDWTVLTEPECLKAGEMQRVCASCGEKQIRELSPLGHDVHNNECVRCGKKAVIEDFTLLPDRFDPEYCMVEKCFSSDEDVLIPDVYGGKPVVRVRYESFANNEAVRYISIPDSVGVVESWALAYAPNLEMVRIGKNVTDLDPTFRFYAEALRWLYVEPGNERYHSWCSCIIETATKTLISGCGGSVIPDDGSVKIIANSSFSNVKNLTKLDIPDSVTEIREFSMNNCEGLLALYLPDSVKEIGQYAFEGCSGIRSLRLPSGLTELGLGWFRGCSSLEKVVLPKGVTDTGVSCFEDCTSLEKAVLPDGLQRIGNYTFRNCTSLENVTLPQSLTKLGDAFADCESLKELVIPDGVADPGVSVISYCTSLTKLVLPKEMTRVPYHFFSNLTSIESVVLPEKITQIEYNAFMNCPNLKSVVFPASLKIIQYDVFVDCPSLETVYYAGSRADWEKIRKNGDNEVLNKVRIVYDYKG